MRWSVVVVAAGLALSGCAPGVWVRPGASVAETQETLVRCDMASAMAVGAGSSPGRSYAGYGTRGIAVAAGASLLDSVFTMIGNSVQRDSVKSTCMASSGFQKVTPEAAAASASARVTPGPQVLAQSPTQLTPQPAPGASGPAKSAPEQYANVAATVAPALTTNTSAGSGLYVLPSGADEDSFLLGACSAGDRSACIRSGQGNSRAAASGRRP